MKDDKILFDFLNDQPLATISTVGLDSLQPQSALIGFTQTKQLEIIFETFTDTRKYENLKQNPCVALVAGWNLDRHITLQYEGRAEEVPESEMEKHIRLFLPKDTPATEMFLRDPRARLFKVYPTWIRYADYTEDPPRVIEKGFKS